MSAAPEYFNQARRTALIVDDSRLACAVLSRLLEKQGFDIELAASGQEALDRVRERRPDVIFMDHLMPGMMGLDAVRTLKSDMRTASIPVVMFSSQEDGEFLSAARAAGAAAVLTKHTERSNLAHVLERLGAPVPAPAPLRVQRPQPAAEPPAAVGITSEQLRAELAPLLREQRDQIRAELLAEFAILENHQEGTRRALMGRLEAVLQRSLGRVADELAGRIAPPRRSWAGLFARGALVAAVLALLAVPIGLTLEQQQRLDAFAATSARLRASVEAQAGEVRAMRHQVDGLGRSLAAASAELRVALALDGAVRRVDRLSGDGGSGETAEASAVLAGIAPVAMTPGR